MKKQIVTLLFVAALSGALMAAANEAKPTVKHVESLSLDQALEMAESLQPELAEAKAMVEAAEGRARQAGAFPNPEAILGAQQLPLDANASNQKEYVAGVGQTIPLSGRLSKARQAELLDREVRVRGLEVKRRDIRKRVHSAFATALYQEKAYQAQTEIQQNAEKAVATTQARVEAGDALREDLARVEMELARAKVELQRAESLREQALLALASAMGDADPVRQIPRRDPGRHLRDSNPGDPGGESVRPARDRARPMPTSAPATRAWTSPKPSAFPTSKWNCFTTGWNRSRRIPSMWG